MRIISLTFIETFIIRTVSIICQLHNQSLPHPTRELQLAYYPVTDIAFIFGGYNGAQFLWEITKWFRNKPPITVSSTHAISEWTTSVGVIQDIAYFVNPIVPDNFIPKSLVAYNLSSESWLNDADFANPLYGGRANCVTNNNTHVFAIGGYNNGNRLQIYTIDDNKWEEVLIDLAFVSGKNIEFAMCAINQNNILYVFGGNVDGSYSTNIMKYVDNEWFIVNDTMPLGLDAGDALHHINYIYIIGGSHSFVHQNSIYVFDSNPDVEMIVANFTMVHGVASARGVVIGSSLYVFGGSLEPLGGPETDAVQICTLYMPPNGTISPPKEPTVYPTSNPTYVPTTDPYVPTTEPSYLGESTGNMLLSTANVFQFTSNIMDSSVTQTKQASSLPTFDPTFDSTFESGNMNHDIVTEDVSSKRNEQIVYILIGVSALCIIVVMIIGYIYRRKQRKDKHNLAQYVQDKKHVQSVHTSTGGNNDDADMQRVVTTIRGMETDGDNRNNINRNVVRQNKRTVQLEIADIGMEGFGEHENEINKENDENVTAIPLDEVEGANNVSAKEKSNEMYTGYDV